MPRDALDDSCPVIGRRTLLQAAGGLAASALAKAQAIVRRAVAATAPLETLMPDQMRVVAAIAERIWPGAEAAGAVTYVDRALVQAYRHEARLYRVVLPRLDAAARRQFGTPFAAASDVQQDALLADLEAGRLPELPGARGAALFDLLRKHVMEGVLSDPIYGGNRDFAGWKAVGYPGPYRVHTEEDQTSTSPADTPYQSITDL